MTDDEMMKAIEQDLSRMSPEALHNLASFFDISLDDSLKNKSVQGSVGSNNLLEVDDD